jgi:hypothetical protein
VVSARAAAGFPSAGEFLTSAGFGGVAALIAAVVVALVVFVAARKASQRDQAELQLQERHYEQVREDRERAAGIALCEQRFRWVVETAGLEPAASESATLGLGPELALELLAGLHRDATRLGDDTLVKAIAVYLNQFSLVLAQQGGPLAHLNGTSKAERDATSTVDVGADDSAVTSPAPHPAGPPKAGQPEPDSPPTEKAAEPVASSETDATAASGTAAPRRRRSR